MLNRNIIYAAPQKQFFSEVLVNRFADNIQKNFVKLYDKKAGESEYNSWIDTGKVIKNLIELSRLENLFVSSQCVLWFLFVVYFFRIINSQFFFECMELGIRTKQKDFLSDLIQLNF